MRKIDEILRSLQVTQANSTDTSSVTEDNSEDATCAICGGAGFVQKDVAPGHPDFGRAFPCRCVLAESAERRLVRLQRYSNLGPLTGLTFDSVDAEGRNDDPFARRRYAQAVEAARAYAEEPQGWLVLYGPSGSGKTHIAAAIANRCLERGVPALYVVVPDLLDHLRAAYSPDSEMTYNELFEQVRNAPLLILDDLGTYSATAWAQEKFFQLVNARFNSRLPTVFVTLQPPSELDERLATRLLSPSLSLVLQLEGPGKGVYQQVGGMTREQLATMTFSNFNTHDPFHDAGERQLLKTIVESARGFAESPDGWLLLLGPNGCGKTHLAAAIANYRLEHGQPVFFAIVPDLLDHLRSSFHPDSTVNYDRIFEQTRTAGLLILDDLGAHSSTPWAEEKLYQIINFRHISRLPTVITSNQLLEQMPGRLASRLGDQKLTLRFWMNLPDYRTLTRQAPDEKRQTDPRARAPGRARRS